MEGGRSSGGSGPVARPSAVVLDMNDLTPQPGLVIYTKKKEDEVVRSEVSPQSGGHQAHLLGWLKTQFTNSPGKGKEPLGLRRRAGGDKLEDVVEAPTLDVKQAWFSQTFDNPVMESRYRMQAETAAMKKIAVAYSVIYAFVAMSRVLERQWLTARGGISTLQLAISVPVLSFFLLGHYWMGITGRGSFRARSNWLHACFLVACTIFSWLFHSESHRAHQKGNHLSKSGIVHQAGDLDPAEVFFFAKFCLTITSMLLAHLSFARLRPWGGVFQCTVAIVAVAVYSGHQGDAEFLKMAIAPIAAMVMISALVLFGVVEWEHGRRMKFLYMEQWIQNIDHSHMNFIDHQMKQKFAGSYTLVEQMLDIIHSDAGEGGEDGLAVSHEEISFMCETLLKELRRGKELCYQLTMQRQLAAGTYIANPVRVFAKHEVGTHDAIRELHNDVPEELMVDWNIFQHILDNARSNARTYGGPGPLKLIAFIEKGALVIELRNAPGEDHAKHLENGSTFTSLRIAAASREGVCTRRSVSTTGNMTLPPKPFATGTSMSNHVGLDIVERCARCIGASVELRFTPTETIFELRQPLEGMLVDNPPGGASLADAMNDSTPSSLFSSGSFFSSEIFATSEHYAHSQAARGSPSNTRVPSATSSPRFFSGGTGRSSPATDSSSMDDQSDAVPSLHEQGAQQQGGQQQGGQQQGGQADPDIQPFRSSRSGLSHSFSARKSRVEEMDKGPQIGLSLAKSRSFNHHDSPGDIGIRGLPAPAIPAQVNSVGAAPGGSHGRSPLGRFPGARGAASVGAGGGMEWRNSQAESVASMESADADLFDQLANAEGVFSSIKTVRPGLSSTTSGADAPESGIPAASGLASGSFGSGKTLSVANSSVEGIIQAGYTAPIVDGGSSQASTAGSSFRFVTTPIEVAPSSGSLEKVPDARPIVKPAKVPKRVNKTPVGSPASARPAPLLKTASAGSGDSGGWRAQPGSAKHVGHHYHSFDEARLRGTRAGAKKNEEQFANSANEIRQGRSSKRRGEKKLAETAAAGAAGAAEAASRPPNSGASSKRDRVKAFVAASVEQLHDGGAAFNGGEGPPPGLIYYCLDDSALIRMTSAGLVRRVLEGHSDSKVLGGTDEEILGFVDLVMSQATPPDLIMLDQNLDSPSNPSQRTAQGTDIMIELKARGYAGPIIIRSANDSPIHMKQFQQLGADALISKSAPQNVVKAKLGKVWEDHLLRGRSSGGKAAQPKPRAIVEGAVKKFSSKMNVPSSS